MPPLPSCAPCATRCSSLAAASGELLLLLLDTSLFGSAAAHGVQGDVLLQQVGGASGACVHTSVHGASPLRRVVVAGPKQPS
jgi:hypothetical protein